MAGDWIPMRIDLYEDPAVIQLAEMMKVRTEVVVGYLHKVWSWASRQCNDGSVTGVTLKALGTVTNLPDFPEMMVKVGWLEETKTGINFPKFERWLSQSAKQRALTKRRVQTHRSQKCNARSVTKPLPEKRREEKSKEPPVVPQGTKEKELVDLWNSLPSMASIRKLTSDRARKLKTRLKDPEWEKAFREALSKLPIPGDGWQPEFDWMVKNEKNVFSLLEDKFGWRGSKDNGQVPTREWGKSHENNEALRKHEIAKAEIKREAGFSKQMGLDLERP